MKQTQCPSSGAKHPFWCELFPKLDSARSQETERGRGRDINALHTTQRWQGTPRSGATPAERFKVGLTTLRPRCPSAALFMKWRERGQQQNPIFSTPPQSDRSEDKDQVIELHLCHMYMMTACSSVITCLHSQRHHYPGTIYWIYSTTKRWVEVIGLCVFKSHIFCFVCFVFLNLVCTTKML